MGNAAPAVTGGWFSFSEELTPVVLRLHDHRNMGLTSGEEVLGGVSLSPDPSEVACARRAAPARFTLSTCTNLHVDFQAVRLGGVGEALPSTGRRLGDVRLPLEYIARRCGGSLYHMWLPLNNTGVQPGGASVSANETSAPLGSSDGYTLDHFDRALRNAARDPRLPMVCLSLCQANLPEAELERYDLGAADDKQKALRFHSLLQSHAQHARLLQALYRQCRSVQQSKPEASQLRDALLDSWSMSTSCTSFATQQPGSRLGHDSWTGELPGLSEGTVVGSFPEATFEDAAQLRREIESTTNEANARINQASEAIRTLKERLAAKQAEHEKIRQETTRFRSQAEEVELHNEQLALELDRVAREGGAAGDQDDARRLRREVDKLAEQKEALVLILEDVYGAVGEDASRGAEQGAGDGANEEAQFCSQCGSQFAPSSEFCKKCGESREKPLAPLVGDAAGFQQHAVEPVEETFTLMLPRPSELFASGVLDG